MNKVIKITALIFLLYSPNISAQSQKKKAWLVLVNYLVDHSDIAYSKNEKFVYKLFAAKIEIKKGQLNKITFNDSIGYMIFPKIDSLIAKKDLSVFLDGQSSGTVVLPIEANARNLHADAKDFKVSWKYLYKRSNEIFLYDKDDPNDSFFDYIFLPPLILYNSFD